MASFDPAILPVTNEQSSSIDEAVMQVATEQLSGDADILQTKLRNMLERLCQQYLVYVNCVEISGTLRFKVDETKNLEVVVSQTVLPVPLEGLTSIGENASAPEDVVVVTPVAPRPPPIKKGRGRKPKNVGVKKKAVALPGTNRRKRGRPRKHQVVVEKAEQDKENGHGEASTKSVSVKTEKMDVQSLDETNFQLDFLLKGGLEGGDEEDVDAAYMDDGALENDTLDEDYKPFRESRSKKSYAEEEDSDESLEVEVKKIKKKRPFGKKYDYYRDKSNNPLECYRCKYLAETKEELTEHKKSKHGAHVCEQCPYVSNSLQKLRIHVQGKHSKQKVPCSECHKSFSHEDTLKKHMKDFHTDCWKCPICDPVLSHSTKNKLLKHLEENHSGHPESWEVLCCDLCKVVLMTVQQLEAHKVLLHNHICSSCGAKFETLGHMVKHRMKAHPQLALTCSKCGKVCPNKQAMYRHLERHREKEHGKYTCPLCNKEFTSRNSLFHHTRGIHATEKKYKCKECGKEFNFHHSLKLHLYKHSGARPYKCEMCRKSYLTSNHLKNHVEAVHSNTKKYHCQMCDKGFPYENSLRMHMLLHDKERPYVCDQCGKSFVAKSALRAHEQLHTDESHHCTICHKVYRTKMLLRAHMRRHTDDGHRYMCDICGNTFMYQSTLNTHMIVHGNTRTFQCNLCDKNFKTYATLYSHRLVHEENIPFTCNICGKGFKTRERVKAHEKRHAGEKPYQCEQCGSSFPDKGGLSKHNKTVHARRPRFQCPNCGKMANRADNLRVHMKIHNDPHLMEMKVEDLMLKVDPGEEPELEEGASLPIPRKRRGLKKEPRVNLPLGIIPNINVCEMNLDAVGVLTAEQQQQILEQQIATTTLGGVNEQPQQQQHIVAELPREITFTLEKVTLDKISAQGLLVDHMQKMQQENEGSLQVVGSANKHFTMHKQLVDITDFEKALQQQKQHAGGGAAATNVLQLTSPHLSHTIETLQNTSGSGMARLDQILEISSNSHHHTTAGASNSGNNTNPPGLNLHVHNTNTGTGSLATSQQQALLVSQGQNPSVITNPLLHLAEVMSVQHHSVGGASNGNGNQVGLNYATLQQYQPFVSSVVMQPQTTTSSFAQNFQQS